MSAVVEDLGCAVDDCSVELNGIRFLPGMVVAGRLEQKAQEQAFTFLGSFQPMTDREMMRLPEGSRNDGRAKVYTRTELKTVDTSEARIADRIEYKGVTYQVDKVHDWDDLGAFFKVEVVRMGQ